MATTTACIVIGATGFVGSHVTRELVSLGIHVKAVTRDLGKAEFLKGFSEKGMVTPVKVEDISVWSDDLEEMSRDVKGFFFCAGYEKQEPGTIDFMVNSVINVSPCLN